MEDLEKRIIRMEERLKMELGDDDYDGGVWRVLEGHTTNLRSLEDKIYRGNGDSLVSQIVRLRTEMRALCLGIGLLLPVILKVIERWY